jgi:hypothetical protein
MNYLDDGEDAVKALGLLKRLWNLGAKPGAEIWRKVFHSDTMADCGYMVLHRKISAHYKTRTTGVITHEIEIKSTRDHTPHYQGRYQHRGGKEHSNLVIKTFQKHTLDEIEGGYQKFTVQLSKILAKNETEKIIMENEWKEQIQNISPEIPMYIFAPTLSLEFIISLPSDSKIIDPKGEIRQHSGAHPFIESIPLTVSNQLLSWNPPHPKRGLAYHVKWKWDDHQ